ncbi:hypothetical protein EDD86DRAFT_197233 [Gorgonomyces haynaldii]|nr:hypothetical protein EDD86DRAFT_197233 [Gorgonomyces haynaldii]
MKSILAQPAYIAQWENNTQCQTQPDAIYFLNVTFDTFPTNVPRVSKYVSLDWCGSNSLPLSGCCNAYKVKSLTNGYQSAFGSYWSLDHSQLVSSANGLYCVLTPLVPSSRNYTQLFIKATGDCVDGQWKCFNNRLEYYSNSCQSSPQVLNLDQTSNDTGLGPVFVSQLTISKASKAVDWTSSYPSVQSYWSEPFEILCQFAYIAAIASSYFYLFLLLRDKIQHKKRGCWTYLSISIMLMVSLVTTMRYSFYLSLNQFVDYTGQDGNRKLWLKALCKAVIEAFSSVCTIVFVILTYHTMVIPIFTPDCSKRTRIMGTLGLIVLHLVMDGLKYCEMIDFVLKGLNNDPTGQRTILIANSLYTIYPYWRMTSILWMIFAVVFNFIPPVRLAFCLAAIRTTILIDQILLLIQADPWLLIRFMLQILYMGLYVTVILLFYLTNIYGSDSNVNAADGLLILSLVLYFIVAHMNTDIVRIASNLPKQSLYVTTSKTSTLEQQRPSDPHSNKPNAL